MLLWETLEGSQGGADDRDVADDAGSDAATADLEARAARYRDRVAWVADEQAAGRLARRPRSPPAVPLPRWAPRSTRCCCPTWPTWSAARTPRTEAFAERYRAHLEGLAAHLAPGR